MKEFYRKNDYLLRMIKEVKIDKQQTNMDNCSRDSLRNWIIRENSC